MIVCSVFFFKFKSLVSFTGFHSEDKPDFSPLYKPQSNHFYVVGYPVVKISSLYPGRQSKDNIYKGKIWPFFMLTSWCYVPHYRHKKTTWLAVHGKIKFALEAEQNGVQFFLKRHLSSNIHYINFVILLFTS